MEWTWYFLVALGLSFLGSVPIGLITLNIVQSTIQRGRKSGILLALGATIIEYVYTHIPLAGLEFFSHNDSINSYIKLIAMVVFFGLGTYYLLKKSNSTLATNDSYHYFDFFRGMFIAAVNMLVMPFWIFIALWLQSYGFSFDSSGRIIAFSLGAAIGALIAFLAYVALSELIVARIQRVHQYTDKVVGALLLGLGFFQLFQWVPVF